MVNGSQTQNSEVTETLVEQLQTPLQIPHLMGNLERCLELLYTYLSQSCWVMGDESTLAPLWRHMRSEGRRILASNAFRR